MKLLILKINVKLVIVTRIMLVTLVTCLLPSDPNYQNRSRLNKHKRKSNENAPCRIRSDRQTTSLTLTTGVCEAGTKMRGASNMNIHYDVTGLLTAAWRSHSGQIVWAA